MNRTAAARHLVDFLAQRPRTAADEFMQAGIESWLRDGDTLPWHRCFDLPASPAGVRRIQRDRILRQLAEILSPGNPYGGRMALHREITHYIKFKAQSWCRLRSAPAHATLIERSLFDAARLAPLPKSAKMLRIILAGE